MRFAEHPILGTFPRGRKVTVLVDGQEVEAFEGEMIAFALHADGIKTLHWTAKRNEPRGIFCAIGHCTDCMMIVDGVPNVRACITPVREGMRIETQHGRGEWRKQNEKS